jgi:protein-arginine kinase activator protein McsA
MRNVKSFAKATGESCETCGERAAAIFMVVRENGSTAKAHVCIECFQEFVEIPGGTTEAVSLQEFKETEEEG